MIVVASALYLWGLARVHQKGLSWPPLRTTWFFVLGVGSYAAIELGFLGVYSAELRWAFATRVALLIFVVPAGVVAGAPLELIERATGDAAAARIARVLQWRIVRLFGNAVFATIFIAAVFCLFLTPLAGVLRANPVMNELLGILVPLMGLALALPLSALTALHTGLFITVEFLLAFVELVIDSVPGILLRLDGAVVDHAATVAAHGGIRWWPSPMHDQHLAGDMLWFIAEVADVPVLVILMIRWMRSDRREAKQFDDLSDEEYEAMTQAHLAGKPAE